MIDAPVYVPFLPPGVRPAAAERLQAGQVAVRPESARPLNDPEAMSPGIAIRERPSREQPRGQGRGAAAADGELAARARVAAQREGTLARDAGGSPGTAEVAAIRRRVEVAVRLALPSEESRRELSIVV